MRCSLASLLAVALASTAFAGAMVARANGQGAGQAAVAVNEAAVLAGMPRTLAEFGFFADAARQQPAAGVRPYTLRVPLYSDGADKLRFAYLPAGKQPGVAADGLIEWPVGSALIKTFAYGEGADRRLIETRVLLHRADGWLALPYRWNAEQTEARLALAGARLELETPQHGTISYRVPNKNQCKECHGLEGAVVPIGPKLRNLDTGFVQAVLGDAPADTGRFPDWSTWRAAAAEPAARAYLDVNCAHCHRPGATASNSGLDLRWTQTDRQALGVFKRPVAAGRGAGGLEYSVQPGDPARSIMVHRMNSVEPGIAMPELGKATVDAEGVAAVERWIEGMR